MAREIESLEDLVAKVFAPVTAGSAPSAVHVNSSSGTTLTSLSGSPQLVAYVEALVHTRRSEV